jgi:G3E family GTPase
MTTPDPPAAPAPVPVTILTGFLGAGKTTLLNRLLTGDHRLRVGVLVNDFGPLNIDADLVVGVDEDMISLANGCVCCQIRDDLVDAVERLLARPEPPEYILLEASGVADPLGIWSTFIDAASRDRIRLDSITCVVDAEQAFAYAAEAPELPMLKLRQIGCADLVVLNKTDLAGPEQTEAVRRWIDHNLRRVRIVEASYGDVPNEVLLGVGRFDPTQLDLEHEPHGDHGEMFETWSYTSDRPMSLAALEQMIRRELPGSIYRCKGVVHSIEEPERRSVLQAVGRRSELVLENPWGERVPTTSIVAIGRAGELDAAELQARFDGCLADPVIAG